MSISTPFINRPVATTLLTIAITLAGGIAYFPHPGESVATASAEIAQDLREQYMLGYPPQNMNHPDAFRKIEVKVTAPGRSRLRVRTRPGYTPAAEKLPTAELRPEY